MSLKNNVIKLIEWWISLTKSNTELYKTSLQALLGGCDRASYHTHLLNDLSQIGNIKSFPQETEAIYNVIRDFCGSKRSKKRFNDLGKLFENFSQFEASKNFDFKYLEVFFTISFIQVLSKTSQPHWYKLEPTENLSNQLDRTRTLIELVTDFAESVLLHHKLLYCLGYLERLPDELALQKYCHIFVREIALSHKNILTIHNKDLRDVVFKDTQNIVPKHLKLETSVTDANDVYEKQIAVATILLELGEPKILHYGVCQQPLACLNRDKVAVLVDELPLHCYDFLHQKHNKPHTVICEEFYENVRKLMDTKFYLDEEMLERVKLTVNAEFEEISQEICSILGKHLHFLESTVANSADAQLKLIFKKLLTYFRANSIKLRSYKTAYKLGAKLNTLPEVQVYKLRENKETIGLAGEMAVFLLSLNSTKHLDEYLSNSLHKLQTCLTRLYLIREFRNYAKLLADLELQYVQFPIYSDFRGRIYYNSHASPQSYWYFRFIYHFGWIDRAHLSKAQPSKLSDLPDLDINLQAANSCELEIYLAIGVLFKTECTDEVGKIFLNKLLLKGHSVYSNYNSNYEREAKLSAKENIELFYYVSTLRDLQGTANKLKLKYIFKDTTCSMTQHAGKLLGYRPENLEFLNLNNQTYAYDTYSIYTQHLLKYLRQSPPMGWETTLERYITRTNFKNLIMTVEYGVTERTAYHEYCQTIEQITNLSKPLKQKLLDYKLFKVFYNFFQEGLVNLTLFHSTRRLWTDQLLTNKILNFELPDLSLHNYYYYKSKNIVFYENTNPPTKDKRERHSVSLTYQIHTNLDHYLLKKKSKNLYSFAKTTTAAYVNAIHALDAYYLRRITRHCGLHNVPIITIHDGFGVPFTQTTRLIELANIAFCESLEPTNQLLAKNKLPWYFSNSIVI